MSLAKPFIVTTIRLPKEVQMSADAVCARTGRQRHQGTAERFRMGLSVSDAIRLLMVRAANEKRLPFAIQGQTLQRR